MKITIAKWHKTVLTIIIIFASCLSASCLLSACVDEEEFANTAEGNFEALWKIIDERYCYFNYKQHEYGLDWDAVYNKYKVRAKGKLSSEQLYEVLTDMLSELRDGHVNLSTPFDLGRYWAWHENYPSNFSDSLQRRYLGTDYHISSGLYYKILDDNIGYLYYSSFTKGVGEGNLDEVIQHFALCRALIFDIRDNGGGELTNAEKIAARFCHEKTLVGYLRHKTGEGHNDFSEMEPQYLEPSSNLRWHKPVALLTNRNVFSAGNEFVKYMKCFPLVKTVGDRTGGGGGLPFSSSLPNGWIVRFSACPMYDRQQQDVEFGIEPDYKISQTEVDFYRGKDSLIEFARKLLVE
ncbi:MAG: S41 family peptidase [Prevotella sp.]|nr:S41 family peptidase [Prevotella sp.]